MANTEFSKLFQSFTSSLGDVTNLSVASSFLINSILSESTNLVWGLLLVRTMQIIGHFSLLNVMMPSNAHTFYSAIIKIAQLDIVPLEAVIDELEASVNLVHDDFTLSDSMVDFGYDSSDPIRNLQIMFLFVIILVVYPIFSVSFRCLFFWNKWCGRCLTRVNRSIFWTVYIRFILEAFLELAISSLLRCKVLSFENWSDSFQSSFALAIIIFIGVFWVFTTIYLQINFSRVN